MSDTKLIKAKNNEAGTFGATLSAGGSSATLSAAPDKAPGVIVAEIGTANEEHIYYSTKDDVAKTISGLIRDYTNLNGGTGIEHLNGAAWETAQSSEYLNNIVDAIKEGYIYEPNTIAYVSTSSFTVSGDQTGTYTSGRPLRYNQDNTKIGLVSSSSYSSGTGLTTVTTSSGTVPASLTDVEYGIQPRAAVIATGLGVQNNSYNYSDDAGTSTALVLTLSPIPSGYSKGMQVTFKAANDNGQNPTINVNSLGAKNLYLGSQPLPQGYIKSGQIAVAVYDGTQFQVTSVTRDKGWVDLTDGSTINIDLRLGDKFRLINANALGGNRTFTITSDGTNKPWILVMQQDGTGSRTVTWFASTPTFATTDVNTTTDIITINKDIPTGTRIKFTSTTTLPAGLSAGTTYYAIRQSSTTIKVATSLSNAQAGTAVDITDQGTGTHTANVQIRWTSTDTEPTLTTGKYRMDTFGFVDLLSGVYMGYPVGGDD